MIKHRSAPSKYASLLKQHLSRWGLLPLFLIIVISRGHAQYSAPPIECNGQTTSIHFNSCSSLTDLDFSSGYLSTYESGEYKWQLYKDGNSIASSTQIIHCNTSCSPTCQLPAAFFTVSPESGSYKIRLEIVKHVFIGGGCSGFWLPTGNTVFDQYSSDFTVTRLDDGFICKCETPLNLTVNCSSIGTQNPQVERVRNNIDISCNIPSAENVQLYAANQIKMYAGFHANQGSYYLARIDNCFRKRSGPRRPRSELADHSNQQSQTYPIHRTKDDALQVEIFPNPSSGTITINIGYIDDGEIMIHNIWGDIVHAAALKSSSQSISINLEHLPKGLYMVKLLSRSGASTTSNILLR